MCLNALEVDPGRVWKGVWRWYHESMLDCCQPLSVVEREGITFDQLVCLAACNRLHVQAHHAHPDIYADATEFRRRLIESVRSEDTVIVASYSRRGLQQTGDGHFSPLAAYHADSDRVLIMDVARFKYPPHWVNVDTLWNAMTLIDKATDQCRGYMQLRLREDVRPLLVFKLGVGFGVGHLQRKGAYTGLWTAISRWQRYLQLPFQLSPNMDEETFLKTVVAEFLDCIDGQVDACCRQMYYCMSNGDGGDNCNNHSNVATTYRSCCSAICEEIDSDSLTHLFQKLAEEQKQDTPSCTMALLLRAWPYDLTAEDGNIAQKLRKILTLPIDQKCQFSDDTVNEISMLRIQLTFILSDNASLLTENA